MKVLLCGTETQTRALIANVLQDRDHDVTLVDDVEAAWDAFQSTPAELVVVLPASASDVDLAKAVRAHPSNALIVFVCDDSSAPFLHRVFEAGADDCILAGEPVERFDTRFAFIEKYVANQPPRLHRAEKDRQAHQQAVVAEIGRRALAGTEREVLMAYATRVVAEALDVELCKVLKHRPDQGNFLLKAGVGWKDGAVGTRSVDDGVHSQAGYTLHASEPIVVEDLESEDRFAAPQILIEHNVRAGISVAIPSTPEPYGVLAAHSTSSDDPFSEDDVYFLQSVANVLAGAVERSRTEQALRESEAKSRAILETTVDGIITIDERGCIESFNEAAEEIFGYRAEEVIGENVKVLMPQPYREEHDGYMRSYHETGRRRIIGIGREVRGQRKDGSTFPMDLAVSEVKLGDRHIFTGIVRDISERRQLEKEILDVSEQERRRIGQDLHDGLGQMLTGIGLLSQNLTRQLRREEHGLADEMAEITDLMKEADQYARDLARGLTPVDLEASGLSQALQRLADNAVRLFDVQCTFEEVGTALVHNSTAATHMYRIAQEAVSNAVRHGEAHRIKILLASGAEQVRLRVQDDGRGFDPDDVDGPGMGVHIMNYRARIIGGTLEISSDVGDGTVVTCTLPRTAYLPDESSSDVDGGGDGSTRDAVVGEANPAGEPDRDGAA